MSIKTELGILRRNANWYLEQDDPKRAIDEVFRAINLVLEELQERGNNES